MGVCRESWQTPRFVQKTKENLRNFVKTTEKGEK